MPKPKLSSPVTLKNRTLWFGEIELYEDKIAIYGWTWRGPVEETIPLSDITTFEKWTVRKGPNFRLHLTEKDPVFGRIQKGIGFWERELYDHEGVRVKRQH